MQLTPQKKIKSPMKTMDTSIQTPEKFGERFLPNRLSSNLLTRFEKLDKGLDPATQKDEGESAYNALLQNQLFGFTPKKLFPASENKQNLLSFAPSEDSENSPKLVTDVACDESYLPTNYQRRIPKTPYKVLDAPALQDDFYLNVIDWSAQNVLAVGLGSCVYLWSAATSKVTKLCEYTSDSITSVNWMQNGNYLAVGTGTGLVQLYDAGKSRLIRTFHGHSSRLGTLALNGKLLASGSRDRQILHRDIRSEQDVVSKLLGHKQEVCGLKWSFDEQQLSSGGNDNKLLLWSLHSSAPLVKFQHHTAAVKALAWSPHQHGLLLSGGGTADRTIRFWNTLTNEHIQCIDTGSQVCNLMFSKTCNEFVSTHGYSLNQVVVWSYPSLTKAATLTGHTYRVLYLAMSPDGQTIVTGAGDETLRFWNIFPSAKQVEDSQWGSSLLPSAFDLR